MSDKANSYSNGMVSGTINGNSIHFNAPVSTGNQLTKYPGYRWCMLPSDALVTKTTTGYVMDTKTAASSCITGDARLTKATPANAAPTTIATVPVNPTIARNLPPVIIVPVATENSIPAAFKKRKNNITQTIEVSSDQLLLKFYDNATVDGDSISVFINGRIMLTHKRLADTAFTFQFTLNKNLPVNEVAMFAENLGSIPPNTALMMVSDGTHSFDIFLSSDKTSNAVVRIKRKPD